jgi:hypothetical protein
MFIIMDVVPMHHDRSFRTLSVNANSASLCNYASARPSKYNDQAQKPNQA